MRQPGGQPLRPGQSSQQWRRALVTGKIDLHHGFGAIVGIWGRRQRQYHQLAHGQAAAIDPEFATAADLGQMIRDLHGGARGQFAPPRHLRLGEAGEFGRIGLTVEIKGVNGQLRTVEPRADSIISGRKSIRSGGDLLGHFHKG